MDSTGDVREALKRGLTGYLDFKGVASRRDYWTWIIAITLVISIFPGLAILLVMPTMAYGARRMHDVGHSAWLLLVFPVAFYIMLKPSKTPTGIDSATIEGVATLSELIADLRDLANELLVKLKGFIAKSTPTITKSAASGATFKSIFRRDVASKPVVASPAPPEAETTTRLKPTIESDSQAFMKVAMGLGLVTANEDSVVAVTQSLLRQIWTTVRSQQEPDPTHTDHLRLAIRALAKEGLNNSTSANEMFNQAKSVMWYGIALAIISTDDLVPTSLGESARLSPSEALRTSRILFETVGDRKMAARCMEELGQYGRLTERHELMTEGFDQSMLLFNLAGAQDRAKQASTNSGVNFQRHSSAFFDGGQHSLKATTILGSIQGERLRNSLHHVD